jgi:gamma-glutamyltranspeptidase/glutathione hydrolase
MVATSNPLAAAAGARMLAAGGTAADAAIAADAVLGVTDPHLTGIGGDGAAIVHEARALVPVGLNATGTAPAAATVDALRRAGHATMPSEGALSVTVPGAVAGWAALHERFGSLPLATLLAPAIEYARDGAPIAPATSLMWQRQAGKFERHRALARHYLVDGRIPAPGTVRRAPALAAALATIARGGATAFYRGELAGRIADGVRAAGGVLAREDLEAYRPSWVEPLSTSFDGWTVWELPPNTQGLVVLVALDVLAALPRDELSWGTAEYAHAVIEAAKLGFDVRDAHVGDPAAMTVSAARLLGRAATEERLARFDAKRARARAAAPGPRGGTVYVAAADAQGTMVSLISSVFMHFGSGVVAGDTGILMQNRGALFRLEPGRPQTLAPGRHPPHTIIPALAERPGEARTCFGVTGADVQPQGHLQVFLGLARFGMTAQEALDAPRFRVDDDGTVAVEAAVPDETRRGLEDRGHPVRVDDPLAFGAAQMIVRDLRSGLLTGATEPRRDGAVSVW